MRRRPSVLLTGTAAVLIGVSVAASSAQVNTSSARCEPPAGDPAVRRSQRRARRPGAGSGPRRPAGCDRRARRAGSAGRRRRRARRARTSASPCSTATPARSSPAATPVVPDRLGGQAVHRRRPAAAGGQGPDVSCPLRTRQAFDVMLRSSDDSAAEIFWNRSGGNAVISRVKARYGLSGDHGALQRSLVDHHEHRRRPGPLLRHAAGRHRRAAARAGQPSSCPTCAPSTPGWRTRTGTRSGSAFPTGCSANPLRSSRAGCWLERRQLAAHVDRRDRSRPALRDGDRLAAARRRRHRARAPSPRPSRRCSPAGGSDRYSPNRSGRRSRVRCNACSCRHAADLGVVARQQHVGHRRVRASSAAGCSWAPPAGRRSPRMRIILV